jgi:hypothetical protein
MRVLIPHDEGLQLVEQLSHRLRIDRDLLVADLQAGHLHAEQLQTLRGEHQGGLVLAGDGLQSNQLTVDRDLLGDLLRSLEARAEVLERAEMMSTQVLQLASRERQREQQIVILHHRPHPIRLCGALRVGHAGRFRGLVIRGRRGTGRLVEVPTHVAHTTRHLLLVLNLSEHPCKVCAVALQLHERHRGLDEIQRGQVRTDLLRGGGRDQQEGGGSLIQQRGGRQQREALEVMVRDGEVVMLAEVHRGGGRGRRGRGRERTTGFVRGVRVRRGIEGECGEIHRLSESDRQLARLVRERREGDQSRAFERVVVLLEHDLRDA